MSTIKHPESKPTYQDIETALIAVIKAGIFYKKPKDSKFMQRYKERITRLRQAEEPEKYICELAQKIIPYEIRYRHALNDNNNWYKKEPKILEAINNLYKLYYEIAKDFFLTDNQVEQEAEDFINSI